MENNLLQFYKEVEIPYKLNVLYGFIYWEELSSFWEEVDSVNFNAIRNASLEASILFGRHLLQFFEISIQKNGNEVEFVKKDKWKDDFMVSDLDENLVLKPDNPILNNHKEEIIYLNTLANKRVAHVTLRSNSGGSTDKSKIKNAISIIHEIIEDIFQVDKNLLLKYNKNISLTT